jgi:DNA replicative helicase MCM subunit Mcm2 (Cdc46/Mcm family)
MAEMWATEPMAEVLSRRLQAERAPPVLGFVTTGALGWAVFWLGLILAFPFNARIRSAYLYNEKLRGLLSLWFVPLLLTLLPFLRKLLLLPFRDRLLADARLTDFDPTTWYPNVRVSDRRGTTRAITEALPHIRGNILLIGESGLGKTTFLRLLASQTHRTLVFLNARGCEKVGVPEAIRRKASEVQGEEFFKSLIATRDLAVIIDALNEVNADIRASIVAFVNDFPKADILVATQPIESIGTDRSPFETARTFYLRPLADEDIARFLLSRPDRELPDRPVTREAYDAAVRRFVDERLDSAPSEEARVTARTALSNPANGIYAADLLSRGKIPSPNDLIGQAFELACAAYRDVNLRDFPRKAFAAKAVELRLNDLNYLANDELPNEQGVLLDYRLLVTRPMYGKDAKSAQAAFFRHDTVMDYFMYIAFADDDDLQTKYMDDPRFRGVYLLFAERALLERAQLLRDLLVTRAAETGDHTLSDEYVRRLNARDPQPSRADSFRLAVA